MDTQRYQAHVKRLFVKPVGDQTGQALHAAVGASTEAGELLDQMKKHWIYGKPLALDNVVEECGDILFYITAMLSVYGYTLDEAAEANIIKLEKRYPKGYTDAAAQARADKGVQS